MPKFTVYVPVDLQKAFAELDRREVDKSKLFCDAMLGFLLECEDYQPDSNTTEDLALRVKRLEAWVNDHISDHEAESEAAAETADPTTGTIHIAGMMNGGYSLCGITKGNSFVIDKAREILEQSPETSLCMACRKIHAQAMAAEVTGEDKGYADTKS